MAVSRPDIGGVRYETRSAGCVGGRHTNLAVLHITSPVALRVTRIPAVARMIEAVRAA
jgi:hypothetical protein